IVDPRMAQATAVHTKIATIAIIGFNMVVCVSTLSAATSTYSVRLALQSTFHNEVKSVRGSSLLHVAADFNPPFAARPERQKRVTSAASGALDKRGFGSTPPYWATRGQAYAG